jgi:hypothetical protein
MWQVVRNVRSAIGRRDRVAEEAPPSPLALASHAAPGPTGQARVLFPDEFSEENDAPTPAFVGRRDGRVLRRMAYGAAGLLAAAGLIRLGSVLALPRSRAAAVEPSATAWVSPQLRVDRVADTLALATGAFDLRARLFQSHQMQCSDLARGLVVVEERWAEYNAARAANGITADSAHTALDRSLYAGVDATERQFEESKCPRP